MVNKGSTAARKKLNHKCWNKKARGEAKKRRENLKPKSIQTNRLCTIRMLKSEKEVATKRRKRDRERVKKKLVAEVLGKGQLRNFVL